MKGLLLSKSPPRGDLTDREVAKILGGLLGSIAGMTDLATVRRAVRWWAETDEAWSAFAEVMRQAPEFTKKVDPKGVLQ